MRWTGNEAELTRKRNQSIRAFYLADAGVKRALWQMDQDPHQINTASINDHLGQGSYSVTLTRVGNQVTIYSVGLVNNETRRLVAVVELKSVLAEFVVFVNLPTGSWTAGSGAQYGQFDPAHLPSGVPLDPDDRMKMYITGSFEAQSNVDIYGDLFVEGNFAMSGSAVVHGDAYIGGNTPGQGTIDDGYGLADGDGLTDTHTLREDQMIEFPTLNTSHYAVHNNLSFTGDVFLKFVDSGGGHTIVERYSDHTYTTLVASHALPSSAVIHVDGDANVKGTVSGKLTIVASDDIGFKGNIDYANGTHFADANNAVAFLAYDDLRFYPTNLEVSGILFTETGRFRAVGWGNYFLRIYGNRLMASQSSMSSYTDRAYIYDPGLKNHPPPGLPLNPVLQNWTDLGN